MTLILKRTENDINRIERKGINDNWTKIENNFNNVVKVISENAFEEVANSAKLIWQQPVDTFADLSSTYPNAEIGWAAWTREVVNGVSRAYRYDGSNWVLQQEFLGDAINEVDNRLTDKINLITVNVNDFERLIPENSDSARIQRAIDFVSSRGGGTVLLDAREYLLTGQIRLKDNVELIGSPGNLLKVSDSATGFYSMLDIMSCENVSIKNINYDGNYDRSNYDLGNSLYPEAAIRIVDSNNVKILDNTFKTHGVWTIVAQVSSVYPNNSNIWVERNIINSRVGKNTRTPDSTGLTVDTTQIYIDAINYFINDNVITSMDNISPTAIETHRKSGFAKGNIINGYRNGVLIVPGQFAEADDYTEINVSGNTIKNARQGIVLWQLAERNIDMVIISDNSINININRYQNLTTARAISVLNTLPTSSNMPIRNVKINDNNIKFEEFLTEFTDSNFTQNFVGIDARDWVTIENIEIDNNTIVDAPGIGILVGNDSNAQFVNNSSNIFITDNKIIDAGKNVNIATTNFNPRCGIRVSGGVSNVLNNLIIFGNSIIDTKTQGSYITDDIYLSNVNVVVNEKNNVIANGFNLALQSEYNPQLRFDSQNGTVNNVTFSRYKVDGKLLKLIANFNIGTYTATGFAAYITLPETPSQDMNVPILVTNFIATSSKPFPDKSHFLEIRAGNTTAYLRSLLEDNTVSSLVLSQLTNTTKISINAEYLI